MKRLWLPAVLLLSAIFFLDAIAQTAPLHAQSTLAGEPCGRGEQFSDWGVCLHGTVRGDNNQPLAGAVVTVTINGKSVARQSLIHPGDTTPTYAIDISVLDPEYLQPMQVAAAYKGRTLQREMLVFPDFKTQNQQLDFHLNGDTALTDARIWGYVIDFASGKAVAGASVRAGFADREITAVTQSTPNEPLPHYQLSTSDLAQLNVNVGDTITLTAELTSVTTAGLMQIGAERQQANLLLGWECDPTGILPRNGGSFGVPRNGGSFGVPDAACIWGYGLVDGQPTAGMTVRIKNGAGDVIGQGETKVFGNERAPRFAILVTGADSLNNQQVTIEGIYAGEVTENLETIQLDGRNTQQVAELVITGLEVLSIVANDVWSLAVYEDALWVTSSGGGVVQYSITSGALIAHYAVGDGLASNIVYNIQRDREGAFWFGTQGGISHFRPAANSWTTYTAKSAHSPITDNFIVASAQGPDGVLWFAFGTETSDTGLARYDLRNPDNPWTTYLPATFKTQYAGGRIRDLAVDAHGTLWIASEQGVTRFQAPQSTIYTTENTNGGLTTGIVRAIAVAPDGKIWVGTEKGVSCFDPTIAPGTWTNFAMTLPEETPLADDSVADLAVADNGLVWIATNAGAGYYDPTQQRWTKFREETTDGGLVSNQVTAVSIEGHTSIWFGTANGISHFQPEQPLAAQWQPLQAANRVAENRIRALAQAPNGALWVGTPNGVSRYAADEWKTFTKQKTANGLPDNFIQAIIADADGIVWLGSNGKGIGRYVGTNDQWLPPLTVANSSGGLVNDTITAFALQPDGTLWIGTAGGISRYQPTGNQWTPFTTATTGGGLISDTVHALAVDQSTGVVWVGTAAGLSRYTPQPPHWQSFTVASTSSDSGGGLPSNQILSVAIAPDSSLWIGAKDAGVAHYQPAAEPKWERFTSAIANGLPTNEVGHIALAEDGAIWFGAVDGVARYTPGGHPAWEQFLPVTVPPNHQSLGHIPSPLIQLAGTERIWFGTERGVSLENILPQRSDLAVQFDMDHLPERDTAIPGVTKHYTLTVANYGERDAPAILQLELPNDVAAVVADPPPASGVGATTLTWLLGKQVAAPGTTPAITPIRLAVTYAATAANQTRALQARVLPDQAEQFVANNAATWTTRVLEPNTADVRVTLVGPPVVAPDVPATYTAWVENIGGLTAENTQLTIQLPPGLSTSHSLVYNLGSLRTNEQRTISITATGNNGASAGQRLTLSASVNTATPERVTGNNSATAAIPVGSETIETLILVAGQQMADNGRFGVSPLLSMLYTLAAHEKVKGALLDVQAPEQSAIHDAYATWNASNLANSLENVQSANQVAEAIRDFLKRERGNYANLRYIVFVGGDDIIPFYRVQDGSETFWKESQYAASVLPTGTVQAALLADHFLTDDFYTDFDPIVPDSQRWPRESEKVLYLPDYASGRLVESAAEIMVHVESFLANDGQVALNQGLIGADALLTVDAAYEQYALLTADAGAVATPISDPTVAYQTLQAHTTGAIWDSQHSNHYALGEWKTSDIAVHPTNFAGSVIITIGCHAGLSVPGSLGNYADTDLAQAILGRGGAMIGTSAYAYASRLKVSYSEALAIVLTKELVAGGSRPIGVALNRAKVRYYSENAGWMDALDEKVLLPMTLYGLPMLTVATPDTTADTTDVAAASPLPSIRALDGPAQSAYVKAPLHFAADPTRLQRDADAPYYTYAGHALVQEGAPIQPAHQLMLTTMVETNAIRGLILRSASYTQTMFIPAIAQSFVVGAGSTTVRAAAKTLFAETTDGWDRAVPHSLGYLPGFSGNSEAGATLASVNLVLGAYNREDDRYRLFNKIALEVLYSNSLDVSPPTLVAAHGVYATTQTELTATVADDTLIVAVVGLCDNGQDAYVTVDLQVNDSAQWRGLCPTVADRFLLQLVDAAGNVTTTDWQRTTGGTINENQVLYLPIVLR